MFKAFNSCAVAATIAFTLAVSCAAGLAQDSASNDRRPVETTSRTDDEGFNYGWLGLAGLLGLLGLMPRNANRTGVTVRDGAGNVKH